MAADLAVMLMANQQRRYVSYLLRLWQAHSNDTWVWRASLEDSHTGARHSFADLSQLFTFIEKQVDNEGSFNKHQSDVEA
jgi:hypothetical protein